MQYPYTDYDGDERIELMARRMFNEFNGQDNHALWNNARSWIRDLWREVARAGIREYKGRSQNERR